MSLAFFRRGDSDRVSGGRAKARPRIGVALGASAATTTYVQGHAAKMYLGQGCQWGPRGIKTVIQQIVAEAKADSVIERLRDDLKTRITR